MDFTDSEVLGRDDDEREEIGPRIPLAHQAAAGGDTDALSRAIQADPSVLEHEDPEGYTPLAHAVMAEQFDSLKMLVKVGASINSKDKLGRTGLAMAAYQGWYDGLVFLLRNGAKPSIYDEFGRTPLHSATYPQQPRVFARLLQNLSPEKVNQQDHEGMTALHWCAFHNRPLHIELLWHKDADPFLQDVDGHTALHWAAQNGSIASCEQLLITPHGPKLVNTIDSSGKTALHLASAAGQISVIKVLSKVPTCNLHAEDPDQRTAMHWAAAMGQAHVIRCLLHLQLNPRPIDVEGATPLMYAYQFKYQECIRILEQHLGVNESRPQKSLPATANDMKDSQTQKPKNALNFIVDFFRRKKPSLTSTEISDDSGATYSDSSESLPELTSSQNIMNSQMKRNTKHPCHLEDMAVMMQKLSHMHHKEALIENGYRKVDADPPKSHARSPLPPVILDQKHPKKSNTELLEIKTDPNVPLSTPRPNDRKKLEQTAAIILGRDIECDSPQPSTSKNALEPLKMRKVLSEEDNNLHNVDGPLGAMKAPNEPLGPLRGHLPPPNSVAVPESKKEVRPKAKKKQPQKL